MVNSNVQFYVITVVIVFIVLFLITYYGVCTKWYQCLSRNYQLTNMYFIALFVIAALICATISGYLANQKVEISDVLRTLFIATLLLMVISSFVFFVLNVQHCSLVLMILALILGIGTCIYISQISSLAGWLYFPLVLFLGFATYVMYDIYNKNYSFGITST